MVDTFTGGWGSRFSEIWSCAAGWYSITPLIYRAAPLADMALRHWLVFLRFKGRYYPNINSLNIPGRKQYFPLQRRKTTVQWRSVTSKKNGHSWIIWTRYDHLYKQNRNTVWPYVSRTGERETERKGNNCVFHSTFIKAILLTRLGITTTTTTTTLNVFETNMYPTQRM